MIKYFVKPIHSTPMVPHKTVVRRMERGWSYERASGVITLHRLSIGENLEDFRLIYLSRVICTDYVDNTPAVHCKCKCGKSFDCKASYLFFDVNCGCSKTGHTPSKLSRVQEMEEDTEFRTYCSENNKFTTVREWTAYRMSRLCFKPRENNATRCVGGKYDICDSCWRYGKNLPDCFEIGLKSDTTCVNDTCPKRKTCNYWSLPKCFNPVLSDPYPLCKGKKKSKCKHCNLYMHYDEEGDNNATTDRIQ